MTHTHRRRRPYSDGYSGQRARRRRDAGASSAVLRRLEGADLAARRGRRCGRSWIRAAVAAPGSPWRRPRHRHLRRQPRHRRRVLRW
jgi:hypothetical protein